MSGLDERLEEATQRWETPAKVLTGGKGPPDTPGLTPDDWLSALPARTTVLIQAKKDQTPFLGQMTVLQHGEKGRLIFIPGVSKQPEWVDPVRWCRDYRLYETIQTAEEADLEEKARSQVERNRTDRPTELADIDPA